MKLRVSKFGGAALADGDGVRRVARLVRASAGRPGELRQVLVVSAHRGVTQQLVEACEDARSGRLAWDALRVRHRTLLRQLDLPGELLDRHLDGLRSLLAHLAGLGVVDARQRDHVLSFGERMSARVVAAHLRAVGRPAVAVDAYDLGLVRHAELAAPAAADETARVALRRRLLGVEGLPVVTGFVALDGRGDLTTLGPNGSDLTATWLAEALGADEVQLWKPVGGVYTADPRLVPEARPLERLGWEDAAALALHGADVLHPLAGAPARRGGIPLRVRGLEDGDGEGTLVGEPEGARPGPTLPVALAHRARVELLVLPLGAGAETVAERAEAARASLEAVGLALEAEGEQPLGLAVDDAEATLLLASTPGLQRALTAVERSSVWPGPVRLDDLAALTPVGPGAEEDVLLLRALRQFGGPGGRLLPARSGSRARTLLVPRDALPSTARALHAHLFGSGATADNSSGGSASALVEGP